MIKNHHIAIFSDLHLGIYGNSEDWHKTALDWADWITFDMDSKGIQDIIFCGDFFHNRSEIGGQTMHVASQILDKFKDFNMIMIVGNHDCYYKNRSDVHSLGLMNGYPNITIVDSNTVFDTFGKRIACVPWNSELPSGQFDYIFGHFEIESFKMNNFKVCDHGLSPMDFLASKTDTVFSGHFHNRNSKKYNEGVIHYVGSTFPMDFSDLGNEKGYHVLNISTGKLDFIQNDTSPKYKKVLVSKIKQVKEEDVQNNIVKLLVDIDLTDAQLSKVQNYLTKFKPWQLTTEYNIVSKTISEVETVDAIELLDVFDEYIAELKLDEDKMTRVKNLVETLYAKHK